MKKVQIQIFNSESRNGRIYVAENKEAVEKLFSKYINEKAPLLLTKLYQDSDFDNHHDSEYYKKFVTVDLLTVAGVFTDIEIKETYKVGLKDKPTFEVWANLKIINSASGDYVKSLMEADVATFGMRSLGKKIVLPDLSNLDSRHIELTKIIAFDLINAHSTSKLNLKEK